jgi:ABC-type sulfate/molybdate transport systems ATPase subunit
MQFWIKDLQRKLGITTIYVTHDQVEAMTVSDRLVVMNRGRIDQVGTSREIYEHPQTKFVATFIGESNVFDGIVRQQQGPTSPPAKPSRCSSAPRRSPFIGPMPTTCRQPAPSCQAAWWIASIAGRRPGMPCSWPPATN